MRGLRKIDNEANVEYSDLELRKIKYFLTLKEGMVVSCGISLVLPVYIEYLWFHDLTMYTMYFWSKKLMRLIDITK